MSFFAFILWVVLCFVIAAGAKNKNRSYGGFFILSLLLSPIIGLIVLLALGEKKPESKPDTVE